MPEFVDPNKVLDQLELRADMVAADFGCGSGGWAIPLARKLEDGKVIAVDVQESVLSALVSKEHLQGLDNIENILADVEREIKGIVAESCDLVLVTDLLFQSEDQEAILIEAYRVLKKGGQVLVVEWTKESPLGPQQNKPSEYEVKQIAEKFGFKLVKNLKAGDYHFALVFKKEQ